MKFILAKRNDKGNGFTIPSEFNKAVLNTWLSTHEWFEIRPRARISRKRQKFLESAVIPAWGHFNYGLDPRKPENRETARILFKQDFHYDILKDRDGNPRKIMKSLKDNHERVLEVYTDYAENNGAPIPNAELYKKWRDEYSMVLRWDNYYDWLAYLDLEVDSMPSQRVFDKLKENHDD